jgi:hypothetical protein
MNLKLEDMAEMAEERIIKGSPLQIGSRTFYPIIKISNLTREGKFYFKSILPLAIAVLEPGEKYLISLNESDSYKMDCPELNQICEELGIKTILYAEKNDSESDDFNFTEKEKK